MSQELDPYRIPAYQRKKSLAAKSRSSKVSSIKKTKSKTIEELSILDSQKSNLFEEELEKMRNINKRELKSVREMKICGQCEGYFEKINVAIIKVTSPIRQGDRLVFEKSEGLFEQTLESMQRDKKDITLVRSGDDIGTKVAMPPKIGTPVYKVI